MTLNETLEKNATLYSEKIALIYKEESINYRDLNIRINSLAQGLLSLGVKKDDKVGILLRNSLEFVLTYFAAVRIGAIAVPLNFLLKPEEIKYILNDSRSVLLVTNKLFGEPIRNLRKDLPKLENFIYTDVKDVKEEQEGIFSFQQLFSTPVQPVKVTVHEEDLATIIYTSGTTGKPKGVMLTHKNFTANVRSCFHAVELKDNDRILCLLPMFHSFAWTVCVLLPLSFGLTTIIVESVKPFTNVLTTIYKHRVSIFVGVPPIFSALTKLPFFVRFFNPVRLCISGAAPLPVDVLDKFEKKFRIPLLEGYGLTEASPVVSINPLGKAKPGSVGRPIPGVKVKIVDEKGSNLSPGEVGEPRLSERGEGELCVLGENIMKGYYNLPEETVQTFLPGGWLRTGDIAKIDDDGYIYIVERKKDLIIIKGLNVYPQEIENVILTHPAVTDTAVVGIPDGTGDEIIKAYCVLKKRVRRSEEIIKKEILEYCRKKLAFYKIPKELFLCKELPKTTLGKVSKKELRSKN